MTESGAKLIAWVFAGALSFAVLAMPQPVDPWEMPSLVLDRVEASDAIRFDRVLAAEAPRSEEAQTLRSLFEAHGEAEANPPYARREYDRRQAAIHEARKAVIGAHGPAGFEAMRAHAVEEFADLFLRSRVPSSEREAAAILGGFPEVAERYGLVSGGVVVAPELTIRTVYKARWNAIHRRPLVEGLSTIELQSYWGWLSLHGWGTSLDRREDALIAFRNAGGAGAEEAAALFDVLGRRPDRAAASLRALYVKTDQLRLRNLALGAAHASFSRGQGP